MKLQLPLTIVLLVLLVAPCFGSVPNTKCTFQAGSGDGSTLPEGLGVNLSFTDARPGELEMIAAGGFRWVRVDFKWDMTETERGKYDFGVYDRLLSDLDSFGLRALLILDYGNPHYDNGGPPRSSDARAAFTRWAIAAAKHFSRRGVLWELYNEPNNDRFWPPRSNVNEYVALAIEVGRAFRDTIPNEKLIGPAVGEMDFAFLEACFKAGLLEYWSAVTVHPYLRGDPELAAQEYCRLRDLIKQYAPVTLVAGMRQAKSVPIISSEWGYSAIWSGMSAETQGQLLARQSLTNLANGISLSVWYDWRDDGTDASDPEHHFGLVSHAYRAGRTPVFEPKPAYKAARTLANFFAGYQFEKRLEVGSQQDFVLVFRKGAERKVAAWTTTNNAHQITLAARSGNYKVTGHVGEDAGVVSTDQKGLALKISRAPVYFQLE